MPLRFPAIVAAASDGLMARSGYVLGRSEYRKSETRDGRVTPRTVREVLREQLAQSCHQADGLRRPGAVQDTPALPGPDEPLAFEQLLDGFFSFGFVQAEQALNLALHFVFGEAAVDVAPCQQGCF